MNKKTVIYILGCVLVFVSAFMLLPWFVSLIYSEETGKYFVYTAIAGFVLGRIMTWKKPEKGGFPLSRESGRENCSRRFM